MLFRSHALPNLIPDRNARRWPIRSNPAQCNHHFRYLPISFTFIFTCLSTFVRQKGKCVSSDVFVCWTACLIQRIYIFRKGGEGAFIPLLLLFRDSIKHNCDSILPNIEDSIRFILFSFPQNRTLRATCGTLPFNEERPEKNLELVTTQADL